ncbi:hypothetical protein, partial [Salmonella enterica]|uniref:hypothetical protein n=1 Tax=Salmonella enterica TaxID=28901 RepID=UPI0019D628C1
DTLLAYATPRLFSDQIRERTLATLETTRDWAGVTSDSPRLLLTHLLLPHAPFIFAADGDDLGLAPCFPSCSALSLPRGD